jgi:lysophospholipase L1-like esterase
MKHVSLSLAVLSALCLAAPANAAGRDVLVPASDPAFEYEGRVDLRDASAPVVAWQSSSVSVDFEGELLSFRFGSATEQVYLNVSVDGDSRVIHPPKGDSTVPWPGRLGAGMHRLVMVKRTEAGVSRFAFLGLVLADGASVRRPPQAAHGPRFLFLGDSITAGACDEDGPADQWEDRSTHNATLSYAAVTSGAFGAQFENISVSGMGIVEGYVDVTAHQVWDRIYPQADAPKADLGRFSPDVVFLNFGQNDASHSHLRKAPLPPSFVPAYLELLASLRSAFPGAEIVILRGGMHENTNDPVFIAAWNEVVTRQKARDARCASFAFTHWTDNHPRVADHAAMARELTDWLRSQPFMAAR